MRLDTVPRRAVAAAVLLAATTAAAVPGTAQAAGTTDVVVELANGLLAIGLSTGDAAVKSSGVVNGNLEVEADLGTVTVTDSRLGLTGWSYSAAVPNDLKPVNKDKSSRTGKAVGKSGTSFKIAAAPTDNGAATYDVVYAWKKVNASGVASDLVVKKPLSVATTTTFRPEVKIVLPSDTEPGAYLATVTHSLG